MNKVIICKALRTTFNKIQSDLLTETYMSDEYLAEKVREMQAMYKEFKLICEEIKEESQEVYEKEILGINSSVDRK